MAIINKILLSIALGIFLIGFATAFEFDNVKSYDPATKEVTITNAFGIGYEIAKIRLISPSPMPVMRGNDRMIAELDFLNADREYKDFQKTEGFSVKTKQKLNKAFTYKYARTIQIDVDNYIDECKSKEVKNGTETQIVTDCKKVKSGTKKEDKIEWVEFKELSELPIGEIHVGLFTDVLPNERGEWIPTFFGVTINEWAEWLESYNVGLVTYWTMNETSGNVTDRVKGEHNLSDVVGTRGASGLIGTSNNFVNNVYASTDNYATTTAQISQNLNTTSGAIAFWFKTTGSPDYARIFTFGAGSAASEMYIGAKNTGDNFYMGTNNNNDWSIVTAGGTWSAASNNAWHFIVLNHNGTGPEFYLDGSVMAVTFNNFGNVPSWFRNVFNRNNPAALQLQFIKRAPDGAYNGSIDEVAIWNRTLTATEISNIYNSGNGMTYIGTFPSAAPNVTQYAPPNNMFNNSHNIIFNWTARDDVNLTNTSLYIDGTFNQSFSTSDNYTYLSEQVTLYFADGYHTWNVSAYDNENQYSVSNSRNFTIDTIAPSISIVTPANGSRKTTNILPAGITINNSVSDANGLSLCYYFNDTARSTITCGNNVTEYLQDGWHNASFYVKDIAGNINTSNITFNIFYSNTNITYIGNIIEGQWHNVTFNISASSISTIAANVSYNDTYPMTLVTSNSTFASFRKQLQAPFVSTDTSYNIGVTYFLDGVAYSATNTTQLVLNTPTLSANATCGGDNPIYLFKFANEETKANIYANISYNIYYGIESPTDYAYGNVTNTNQFEICINNTLDHVYIDSAEISYDSASYQSRKYYLFSGYRYNGTETNVTLYSLATTSATSFLYTIQDNQFNVKVNKYMSLLRWYPELNAYLVVDMGKSDDKGQTIGRVKTEDVDYRIGVYEKNGSLLHLFNPVRFVCSSTPCAYSVFLPAASQSYTDVGKMQQSLVYNTTSKIFTYTWNDPTQATSTMNLSVWKDNYDAATLICSNLGSGFTGLITCNVSAYSGTFRAVVYRTASPEMPLISLVVNAATRLVQIAGGKTMGMFMSFILFAFAFMAGLFNPIVAMVLGVVALIPAFYFGAITNVIFIGVILLMGLVIHFLRRT